MKTPKRHASQKNDPHFTLNERTFTSVKLRFVKSDDIMQLVSNQVLSSRSFSVSVKPCYILKLNFLKTARLFELKVGLSKTEC